MAIVPMAGNSPAPRFEYPLIFDVRVAGPFDSRQTVSDLAAISVELPLETRYTGLLVWVESEKAFYYFKDGVTDTDFIPFSISGSSTSSKFVWQSTTDITNGYVFNHGVNTDSILIQFFLDNKPVLIDYEFLPFNPSDVTEHLNNIKLNPPVGATIPAGLKIVMIH